MAPHPFFNVYSFKVEFFDRGGGGQQQGGEGSEPLYEAAFSEVDGLEITMEPKTIQEGGNNHPSDTFGWGIHLCSVEPQTRHDP